MLDLFAKREQWIDDAEATVRERLPWPRLVLAGGAIAALALVLGLAVGQAFRSKPAPVGPHQALAEALVSRSQVLLGDYPDGRRWLSFYRANQDLLGEPLIGEHAVGPEPACVTFTNYVVCRSDYAGVQGSQWEYPPQVLGALMLSDGIAREVDAPLSSVVKDYIDHGLTAKGRDWLYWLGRPISRPFCPSGGSDCFQAFERQILRFPNTAEVRWQDVRLSPLGLSFGQ